MGNLAVEKYGAKPLPKTLLETAAILESSEFCKEVLGEKMCLALSSYQRKIHLTNEKDSH